MAKFESMKAWKITYICSKSLLLTKNHTKKLYFDLVFYYHILHIPAASQWRQGYKDAILEIEEIGKTGAATPQLLTTYINFFKIIPKKVSFTCLKLCQYLVITNLFIL
jgi:hypothetical protein